MKKMNKIASLVMAAMMALTVSVTANAEGEKVLVNENFEGTVSTSVWTGKYGITDGVNKSISSVADEAEFYCRLGETVESGAMIISYDVMLPAYSAVRIKQVWDNASKRRPYYITSNDSGVLKINNAYDIGSYEAGKWFNITEVVDIQDKKVTLYIDGTKKNEYDWYNAGEASNISHIQTQYNGNSVYIDNAYVASYADKTAADTALSAMLKNRISLEKSGFTVAKNSTVTNAITPITSGAEIISYDISGNPIGGRLMQIYDNTLTAAARTALIAINSKGNVAVNDADTGYAWDSTKTNNLALVFDAVNTKFSVYYNGVEVAKNKGSYKGGADIARVDFQNGNNTETTEVTVSNAWAKSFASYDDAIKYINAINNAKNADAMAYYGVNSDNINTAIADYDRALNSITATAQDKSAIIGKISAMMPYKNIFAENFNNIEEPEGYTLSSNTTVTDGKLQLTNSGSRARLLKSVSESTNLITECDFMQKIRSNIDTIVRVTDNTGNCESIKIYAELGDIKMLYGSGTEGTFNSATLVSNYNANQWYNIKVYSNFDNKTVSVYIDDVFMGTYAFMSTAMENLNRVFDSYTNSAGTYYIDNIKVYNDGILEASSALNIASKASENIALPQNADEYSVSWTTSNADYIAADGTVVRPAEASEPVTLTATVSNGIAGIDTKFKTRAVGADKFEIGRVVYADENEFSTETRTGAKGIKRIYINKNDDAIDGTLIVAMYNASGNFIKSEIVAAKEGETQIASTITEDTTKIKIFVWDANLANGIPYAQTLEIE